MYKQLITAEEARTAKPEVSQKEIDEATDRINRAIKQCINNRDKAVSVWMENRELATIMKGKLTSAKFIVHMTSDYTLNIHWS